MFRELVEDWLVVNSQSTVRQWHSKILAGEACDLTQEVFGYLPEIDTLTANAVDTEL